MSNHFSTIRVACGSGTPQRSLAGSYPSPSPLIGITSGNRLVRSAELYGILETPSLQCLLPLLLFLGFSIQAQLRREAVWAKNWQFDSISFAE